MSTYSLILIGLACAVILVGIVLQLRGMRFITRHAGDERIPLLRSDPDTPMSVRARWAVGSVVMGMGHSLLAGEKVLPWWAIIASFLALVFLTVILPVLIHNKRVSAA